MDQSEGERRLRKGFAMVLDNAAEVLSTRAFEAALQSTNAGEIRESFVSTFKENCLEQFDELLDRHDLPSKLRDLDDRIRTQPIHHKRHLKPLPTGEGAQLIVAGVESEVEAAKQQELQAKLDSLLSELEQEKLQLDRARKRARTVLDQGKAAQAKFALLLREEADTEDEE
ncbi:hypothetical protein BASA81_003214 [Batrachochytrium salamandrivorans]|nr:hypothetical protein BASA81_003214 [Batrachochytrium salamandrivorans]